MAPDIINLSFNGRHFYHVKFSDLDGGNDGYVYVFYAEGDHLPNSAVQASNLDDAFEEWCNMLPDISEREALKAYESNDQDLKPGYYYGGCISEDSPSGIVRPGKWTYITFPTLPYRVTLELLGQGVPH